MQHRPQPRSPSRYAGPRLLILVLALIASSLACSLAPAGDATLRETDISLGIQQTLVAQTATALPLRLLTPVQPSPSSPPPTEAPPPTAAPSATPPPTEAVPPTAAPPTAAPVEAKPIPITEWGSYLFVPLSSGCKVAGTKCWKMDDDYRKISIDNNMYLISKNPVLIDASWSRPALVFWHRYKFESAASVEVRADGVWSTMKILNQMTSGGHWVQEVVDLTMFKGKSVIVRLNAVGLYGAGDWFINDVQIIPNYTP